MCVKNIDVTVKSGGDLAVVSLRQNERICNLRALVAVRFEQAIDIIVLVFGGHVLPDVGTIDVHGIISGVTVHVVFRQLPRALPAVEYVRNYGRPASKLRTLIFKNVELFKPLLDDPGTLLEMLQSDPRIKAIMDENASFRHFLSSDRNLREFFSTVFNPAKIQELGRKRDMFIMRLESMPGGYQLLGRLNYHMRQAHENNVAMTYQESDAASCCPRSGDNPQRGRENKLPLPNPWLQKDPETVSQMIGDLKQKCDHMLQSLQQGDLKSTLEQARSFNHLADSARRALEKRIEKQTPTATQRAATYSASAQSAALYAASFQRAAAYSATAQLAAPYSATSQTAAPYSATAQIAAPYSATSQTATPYLATAQIAAPYSATAQSAAPYSAIATLATTSATAPPDATYSATAHGATPIVLCPSVPAAAPAQQPPLNLCDFMSSNNRRWAVQYESQLLQLTAMGYMDRQRNICALLMSFGDVQMAVKLLEQWNRL